MVLAHKNKKKDNTNAKKTHNLSWTGNLSGQ